MKLINSLLALMLFAACASPARFTAGSEDPDLHAQYEQRRFLLQQTGGMRN
jgi:hypothetical protein